MDRVCRDSMYKALDKAGKSVANVTLILMATFVYGCIELCIDPQYANTRYHNISSVEQRDLGVQVHSSLKAESQVDRMVKKAFSMLAFIGRGI
eukprot:g21512.t1